VKRFGGLLLFCALAIPASLALPSTRVASGQSCAMACDHADAKVCCCASGGGGASFRRCPSPADWFLQSSAMRAIAPAPPAGPFILPRSGFLEPMAAAAALRLASELPEPVPKLLS